MSTCLGLYIDENIIKYAKVSKEREQFKIESFGVKFYDNLDQTIRQIIEETYSYKTPISINLSEEMYNYFDVFALLSKKDLPKAIKTEFESYCTEKNYNPNALESRYAITPNTQSKDKLRVIHISDNKIELNKKIQKFSSYRLTNVTPISMTIPNLVKIDNGENILVVNIEQKTTITTIINKNIYKVQTLDFGSQDILDKINVKENSYQKAYEICKETTIYTSEGQELSDESSDAGYLDDIMPTLYNILGQIQKNINESFDRIDKIYITGTGALINNIDLYFEEYLENIKCEILRPSFVKISPDINIKDYVEVNSAISLALSGLGEGVTGLNFKKTSFMDKLPEILTMEVGKPKNGPKKDSTIDKEVFTNLVKMDFNVPLDKVEKGLLRFSIGVLILFIAYGCFANMIQEQIEEKSSELNASISNTNTQISLIDKDIQSTQNKENEYATKISSLEQLNQKIQEDNRTRKSIPILLNKLMYVMPTGVQLTSIRNTSGTHIEIQAQSESYAQLGYLTASIKVEPILTNVISTSGVKANNIITMKIEGDLP